jgi:hypothetical protein
MSRMSGRNGESGSVNTYEFHSYVFYFKCVSFSLLSKWFVIPLVPTVNLITTEPAIRYVCRPLFDLCAVEWIERTIMISNVRFTAKRQVVKLRDAQLVRLPVNSPHLVV